MCRYVLVTINVVDSQDKNSTVESGTYKLNTKVLFFNLFSYKNLYVAKALRNIKNI